jgi:hypothetical protein
MGISEKLVRDIFISLCFVSIFFGISSLATGKGKKFPTKHSSKDIAGNGFVAQNKGHISISTKQTTSEKAPPSDHDGPVSHSSQSLIP